MKLTKIPLQGMSSEGAGTRSLDTGVSNDIKIDFKTDHN